MRNRTSPIADSTNASQPKSWVQRIAIVFIVVASFGLVVCAGLLIQVFITHQPTFELPIGSTFKSAKTKPLGYYSFLVYMAGVLTLFIAANISRFVDATSKKIGYISVLIGTVLIFCSFWLSYTSDKPEKEWWAYFAVMTWGIGYSILNLYYLVNPERKYFRYFLQIISLILIFISIFIQSTLSQEI